jgi:hypothetical protein
MDSEGRSTERAQLEQVRQDIHRWRQSRPKLGRMPDPLWAEAAALAKVLGVYRVARALGLNFVALRRRRSALGSREEGRFRAKESQPLEGQARGFIEVKGIPLVPPAVSDGAVVEVVAVDGARLTLRLREGVSDVAGLVNALRAWR